jgi:uncharacterized protein YbcC (UPF0753/DUF2309 family)
MKQHLHQQPYCAICELSEIAHLLPHQGPIKDFIHQNTLFAFIDQPFDNAIKKAGDLFQARSYLDLAFYRAKFSSGSINKTDLLDSLMSYLPSELEGEKEIFYDALFNFFTINDEQTLKHLAKQKAISFSDLKNQISIISAHKKTYTPNPRILRQLVIKQLGISFDHEVHQLLFRLLGSFVDQGVSLWPYLNRDQSFLNAVHHLAQSSKMPLKPWINNQELANILSKAPEIAIPELLSSMFTDSAFYTPYLQESLLAHPGWSGMVNVIAHHPESLDTKCAIDLGQLLSLKLALEQQFIKTFPHWKPIDHFQVSEAAKKISRSDKADMISVAWFLHVNKHNATLSTIELMSTHFLTKVWHQALENAYYREVASKLTAKPPVKLKVARKNFQAIFCLDDRECSFRRILEEQSSDIETFGSAGFFGIDAYLKTNNNLPQRICPANIKPAYIIEEEKIYKKNHAATLVEMAKFLTRHGANSTVLGFLSAYTLGHLSLFRLMSSFFHPFAFKKSTRFPKNDPLPDFERSSDGVGADGLFHGYSIQEMADRVYNTLNNMGLSHNFSPLIFVHGHGSSSLNNPHFAAYDCGACSGRPGAINARLFAAMANRASVRELLQQKNLVIPSDTVFIGGFHDTCNDQVQYFETDDLDLLQQGLFKEFNQLIQEAIKKNAQERCRKFALVAKNISPDHAAKEVLHRSHALFEPRPELGHATNAMVLVGRRSRSYQIDLDRRAFLNSYDPSQDKEGEILNNILSAVVPVCGGINLEYYFSRVDPAVYGCGTKLSHNVCSLIGVGNGLDDDLRTGLPIQMTEIHDPVRLLIVIEQHEEVIENTFEKNLIIKPWLYNDWLRVAALHPDNNILKLYQPQNRSWQQL